ncbi:MAG TPA: HAD family phosphatase [Candidatus Binatia bacterium]
MLGAVVFDFNGIIVDDEPIHFRLFQRVFGEEGIDLDETTYYRRYLGFDDRGAFLAGFRDHGRAVGDAKLQELIARKADYYQDAIRHHVAIFPGVRALVEDLARHVPLAVASGALRHEIETILQTANLLNHFRAIVSAEDVRQGKPEPEIFIKALAALNAARGSEAAIAPINCLVIEDSKEGVRGARRAGMKCLAVTNSHPPELLQEADAIVASLEEVTVPYLRRLCV